MELTYSVRYDVWQASMYKRIAATANGTAYYCHGMPTVEDTLFMDSPAVDDVQDESFTILLVIDDLLHLMRRKEFSELMLRIFTTLSHHQHITCFFITQSAYLDKSFTVLHDNTRYLLLTKAHHDYGKLSRTFLCGYAGYLRMAAQKCFYETGSSYLIVDNNNWTHPDHRCKTGFTKNQHQYIFKPIYG